MGGVGTDRILQRGQQFKEHFEGGNISRNDEFSHRVKTRISTNKMITYTSEDWRPAISET